MDWAGTDIGPSPRPADEGSSPTSNGHRELKGEWAVHESKTHKGKVYYFNKKTNRKCWHLPLDVEGDDDRPRLSSRRDPRARPRPMNSSSLLESTSTEFLDLAESDSKRVASTSTCTNDSDELTSPGRLSPSYQKPLIMPRPRPNSSYASTDKLDTGVEWKLTEITLQPQEAKYCVKIIEHYNMPQQKRTSMKSMHRPELNKATTLRADIEVTTSKQILSKRQMSPPQSEPTKSYKRVKLKRDSGHGSIQSTPSSPSSSTHSSSWRLSDELQPNNAFPLRSEGGALPVTLTSSTSPAKTGGLRAAQSSFSFTPVRPISCSPSPVTKSNVPTSQSKSTVLPKSAETMPSSSRKLHDDFRKPQRKSYSSNDGCNSTPTRPRLNCAESRMQKLVKDLQENQKQSTNERNRLGNPISSPQPTTVAKVDAHQQAKPPVSTTKPRPPPPHTVVRPPAPHTVVRPTTAIPSSTKLLDALKPKTLNPLPPHTVVRPTMAIPPSTKFLDALKSPEFDEDGSLVCNAEEQVLLSSQRIAAFNAKEDPISLSTFPSSAGQKTCLSGPQRPHKENSACKTKPASTYSQGSKSTPQSRNVVSCSPQYNSPRAQSTPRTHYTASAASRSHDIDTHATYARPVPSSGPSISNQVNDNFDTTMEWEANEVEQKEMIIDIHNIRKMLCTEELNPIPTSNVPLITAQLCRANFFVVVDSNILMGHLKFLEHLRDHRYTTLEPLVLIIPWAVLQELDKLKDGRRSQSNRALSVKQARLAVNWLNVQLCNNHPRVKGETSFDLSPIQFACSMADDSILKCCRQLEPFAQHVVLLTNDNNLRNKAATLLIQAKSRVEIQAALDGLPPPAARVRLDEPPAWPPTRPRNALDAPFNKDADLADTILCDYKVFMLQVLSNVFTTMMIDAYGSRSWMTIVHIKPPWLVLGDVVRNFLKHWVAVASLAFQADSRRMEVRFRALDSFFNSPEARSYNNTLADVRKILNTSVDICCNLPQQVFGHMIHTCVSKLKVYIAQCDGGGTQVPAEVPAQLRDSNDCLENAAVTPETDGTLAQNDFKLIHNTLDTFWEKLRSISVAGYSYFNIGDNLENTSGPPSTQETIVAAIVNTNPIYARLVASVNGILITPNEKVLPSDKCVVEFYNTLGSICREYNQTDFPISLERLTEFCIAQRGLLHTGIGEIEEFGAKIGVIFNRFVQIEINK